MFCKFFLGSYIVVLLINFQYDEHDLSPHFNPFVDLQHEN